MTLFERFGGIRPMAAALGERPSTVSDWKITGRVPATKQRVVLRRAHELGIPITAEDVVFPLGVPACDNIDHADRVAGQEAPVACDRSPKFHPAANNG